MPTSIVRSSIPDVGESIEISLSPDNTGGAFRTDLHVPADAVALALTFTDAGPDGHNRGPRNARIVVRNPAGEDVSRIAGRFEDGRLCILADSPSEGSWTIEVEYGAGASAEINATSVKRGWRDRLRQGARWFGCKTCRIMLRTFVIVTLLHLGPLVAAGVAAQGVGAVLQAMQPILLEILQQTLRIAAGELPHVISIVLEYFDNPVDRILERLCSWLQLCP
jgi:hypothetical protein